MEYVAVGRKGDLNPLSCIGCLSVATCMEFVVAWKGYTPLNISRVLGNRVDTRCVSSGTQRTTLDGVDIGYYPLPALYIGQS